MKGVIKVNTVDRYLRPIRLQITNLVSQNTKIIEYGCGNGDLLFKLSAKIKSGTGIDNSKQLIAFANKRKKQENSSNVDFELLDITKDTLPNFQIDYSLASLLFHVLPCNKALLLLKTMIATSETTIICGFSKPKSFKQKILLWLDQRFTPHYTNFRNYKTKGYMEGLLNSIKKIEIEKIDTFDPVIKIYKIKKSLP